MPKYFWGFRSFLWGLQRKDTPANFHFRNLLLLVCFPRFWTLYQMTSSNSLPFNTCGWESTIIKEVMTLKHKGVLLDLPALQRRGRRIATVILSFHFYSHLFPTVPTFLVQDFTCNVFPSMQHTSVSKRQAYMGRNYANTFTRSVSEREKSRKI